MTTSSEADVTREVEELLKTSFPNAQKIEVENIGACEAPKLQIKISSEDFEGKSRIEKHRMVNSVLREMLDSGRLHAATYKLEVPPASDVPPAS